MSVAEDIVDTVVSAAPQPIGSSGRRSRCGRANQAVSRRLPGVAGNRHGHFYAHHLSQKDIEICAAFAAADQFDTHPNFAGMESLHQSLRATYTEPEAAEACLRVAQRVGDDDRDAASGVGAEASSA